MTSGPVPWTRSHARSSTAVYLSWEKLPLSEMFRGHIQHTRDLMLLRQLLCLLPSSGEQQVHHSSGRTQCSLSAQTDQLYFIRMRADIDRWREKITVPINRSFGHVSSRSRIENLEPKNQLVSVRLMSAGAKKHTP